VTQVFDFNELVDTVTAMTLEVVGASRCWLEVFPVSKDQPVTAGSEVLAGHQVRIAGMKNITREQIELLVPPGGENVRNDVIRGSKPLLVDKIEGTRDFPSGGITKTLQVPRRGPPDLPCGTRGDSLRDKEGGVRVREG